MIDYGNLTDIDLLAHRRALGAEIAKRVTAKVTFPLLACPDCGCPQHGTPPTPPMHYANCSQIEELK